MEMTTAKTIAVFAIIFGCFAVLYPKIFHPMILNMFGGAPQRNPSEELLNRVPPHLRRPGGGGARSMPQGADDIAQHMRPGPHPGLRAAAEMKKQAGASQGGSGKGMMAVVLPMYAVGIVLYLIYTMTKVFGKGKKEDEKEYMASHFRDKDSQQQQQQDRLPAQRRPQKAVVDESDEEVNEGRQTKQRQRDLERLLMKADKDKISDNEMHQLKQRLLETEAQMTRILAAMDAVSDKVASLPQDTEEPPKTQKSRGKQKKAKVSPEEPSTPDSFTRLADSSPDMDSYEFVSGKKASNNSSTDDDVEELRPAEVNNGKKKDTKPSKSQIPEVEEEDIGNDDGDTSDKENEGKQEDDFDSEEEGSLEYGDDDIEDGLSEGEEVQGSEEENSEHQEVMLGDNEDSDELEEESNQNLRKRKAAKHKARRDD